MTSIPHNNGHDQDRETFEAFKASYAPVEPMRRTVSIWPLVRKLQGLWPILVGIATLIFIAGESYITLASHSNQLEKMDQRMRNVESGVTTLLERTKPQ